MSEPHATQDPVREPDPGYAHEATIEPTPRHEGTEGGAMKAQRFLFVTLSSAIAFGLAWCITVAVMGR